MRPISPSYCVHLAGSSIELVGCLPVLPCPQATSARYCHEDSTHSKKHGVVILPVFSCWCLSCVSYLLGNTARIHGCGGCWFFFFSCDGSKYESIQLQSCCCLAHGGIQLIYGVFVTARHCHRTSITTVPFSVPVKSGTPSVWFSSKSVSFFCPICTHMQSQKRSKQQQKRGKGVLEIDIF